MRERTPSDNIMEVMQGFSAAQRVPSANTKSPGFQTNLLANSLSSRLKLQKLESRALNRDERSAKSDKRKSILITNNTIRTQTAPDDSPNYEPKHDDTSYQRRSTAARSRPRVDSAASDQSRGFRKQSASSRRTNSAGSGAGHTSICMSEITTASSDRAYLGSRASTAFSFASRGVGRAVQVVKRDGVFQKLDKYAPGRHIIREGTFSKGSECDYVIITLGDASQALLPPRGSHDDYRKRSSKVKWSKNVSQDHDDSWEEDVDNTDYTANVQSSKRPATSESKFAFRRPAYCPDKSKVSGIGVMWEIPSDTNSAKPPKPTSKEDVKTEPEKKPMWSWLVNEDGRTRSRGKQRGDTARPVARERPLARATPIDVRTQHSRDLHPVATALDREGTSVTKTKWQVPSSCTSTLDFERSVRGRLELVHKAGSALTYDDTINMTLNSSHLPVIKTQYTQSAYALLAKGDMEIAEKSHMPLPEYTITQRSEQSKKYYLEQSEKEGTEMDSFCESRRGDMSLSPTKSRGDYMSSPTKSRMSSLSPTKSRGDVMSSPTKSRTTSNN